MSDNWINLFAHLFCTILCMEYSLFTVVDLCAEENVKYVYLIRKRFRWWLPIVIFNWSSSLTIFFFPSINQFYPWIVSNTYIITFDININFAKKYFIVHIPHICIVVVCGKIVRNHIKSFMNFQQNSMKVRSYFCCVYCIVLLWTHQIPVSQCKSKLQIWIN